MGAWMRNVGVAGAGMSLFLGGCSSSDPGKPQQTIPLGFMVFEEDVAQARDDTARLLPGLQAINDQGGIELEGETYLLDLVTVDHGGTPAGGIAALESLAERGVVAVIGPPWSSLTLGESGDGSDGVIGVAKERGILLVSGSATAPQISDADDEDLMWRTVPSDAFQAEVSASVLVDEEEIMTAAMFYRDDAWGRGLSGSFRAAFEARGGTIVESLGYDVSDGDLEALDTRDYSPELDLVFESQPEAVYLLNFDEFAAIALQIVSGGYLDDYPSDRPLIYVSDSVFDENTLLNVGPEVLSRLRGTSQIPEEGNDNFESFARMIEARGLGTPEIYDAARHDAAFLVACAIQKVGSLDVDQIKSELREISRDDPGDVQIGFGQWTEAKAALLAGETINYDGPSGTIEFSEAGDPTSGTYVLWSINDPDGDPSFNFAKTVTYGG